MMIEVNTISSYESPAEHLQFHDWSPDVRIQQCVNESHLDDIPLTILVWKFLALAELCREEGVSALLPIVEKELNIETQKGLVLVSEGEQAAEIKVTFTAFHQSIRQQLADHYQLLIILVQKILSPNHPVEEDMSPKNHQVLQFSQFTTQTLTEKILFFEQQVKEAKSYLALDNFYLEESCFLIKNILDMIVCGSEEKELVAHLQEEQRQALSYLDKKLHVICKGSSFLAVGAKPVLWLRQLTCYLEPAVRQEFEEIYLADEN